MVILIDVIIPVYKGYEETKLCLESVIRCQNVINIRIIVINDCSPDPEIVDLIHNLEDRRVVKIHNEKNLGFVKTVNKGIQYSINDVVLLNADTIVTDFWIDKLHQAAYSSERIGTVTPLTNNGTIASVPYFNQDNILPVGYTVERFSNLIERVSVKRYPVIPTAVGHAMYIKRLVIQKIGILDEKTFGRGYYEEVDFSFRVSRAGYKNVLADDTFIFHFGSTSFKQDKLKLVQDNKKKLLKKYLFYPFVLKYFLYFNRDVKSICSRIQMELKS